MKHVFLCLLLAACDSEGGRGTTGRGGNRDMGTGAIPPSGGCEGLHCFQKDCGSQPVTSISGRVTAPNGLDPVYDALVYVPTMIPEFPSTVQCEVCNEPIGGAPVISTNTKVDGTFKLDNMPVTSDVPVIVQKGRFRKILHLNVNGCQDNPLTADQARLPKNHMEGDLPKMAVGLGDYDQIECVLRSIGIDESEFTDPGGNGAVHLYVNFDGGNGPTLESLLGDAQKMAQYNLIFVNCTNTSIKDYMNQTLVTGNLFNYVNTGGRLYVTDWSYDYMEQVPQFAPYVFFEGGGDAVKPQPANAAWWVWSGDPIPSQVSDPTLQQWLAAANATPDGKVSIQGAWALAKSTATDQTMYPSTTWVHGNAMGDRPLTATFDYNMCGKVLWSSYHTQEPGASGSGPFSSAPAFPTYCMSTATTMIPQEKILEYLIFQISSCVAPVS
jgi:hypothetical protein